MSRLSRWELAAETIAVKIRWFGLLFGYALVNLGGVEPHQAVLNTILALGVGYALLSPLPLALTVALTALEVLVAALQAYVFAVLTCIYLSDAVHGGH